MKSYLLLFLFCYSVCSFAKDLNCSVNGTNVYYINGVLTKKEKNQDDRGAIERLFTGKLNQLDSGASLRADGKPKVQFIGIHNPSYGLINDTAELFAQIYYTRTGKDNDAKAIYNVIKNIPGTSIEDKKKYDPNGYFAQINKFITLESINYGTMIKTAEIAEKEALDRSMASIKELTDSNLAVQNKIGLSIENSKNAKVKSLFVAHSQGNAALEAGIMRYVNSHTYSEESLTYTKDYMGVLHVASPVMPLTAPYKTRNIRSVQDKVIYLASRLGDPVYVAPETHEITSAKNPDFSGHLFLDTYLSPNLYARPKGTQEAPMKMSDIFTSTLSDLATDLEDNCEGPKIKLTYVGEKQNDGTIVLNGFFGGVNLSVEDTNTSYDNTKTTFDWSIPHVMKTHSQAVYPTYTLGWDEYYFDLYQTMSNVNTISFTIPWKTKFEVEIKAVNINGKVSTMRQTFQFKNNNPPTISCRPAMNGDGSEGPACSSGEHPSFVYDCLILDDSQSAYISENGSTFGENQYGYYRFIGNDSSLNIVISDGEGKMTSTTLTNPCE